MARSKQQIPTPCEIKALHFLNKNGSATVKEYHVNGGLMKEGRAYTSVMSILNVMYQKGLATRTPEGKAYRYQSAMTQEALEKVVLTSVLANVFKGNTGAFKQAVAELKEGKRKPTSAISGSPSTPKEKAMPVAPAH